MSISHLLVAIALLGLIAFRVPLDAEGKANTRLLAVALCVGMLSYGIQAFASLFTARTSLNSVLIAANTLYVAFFLLLALHFTTRKLPLVGYLIPQLLLFLAILISGTLLLLDQGSGTPAYIELIHTLLLLTATLAFVTINRSREMLNSQPVFWIPTLIVSTGFAVATAGAMVSTILQFAVSGFAGLMHSIAALLEVVATVLLLIFLTANIAWFRNST